MKRPNEMLTAALSYAARGWHVFPLHTFTSAGCDCDKPDCEDVGKHPALKGWPKNASTDPAQIREWWTENPRRGIGIATGEASDLSVLDLDGEEGAAELAELAGGAGMPPTPCVQSRPGHLHYYFKYKAGLRNSAKKIAPHIDVRSEGGYVVAVPSPHFKSGGRYSWLVAPGKVELAEWPEFKGAGGKKRAQPQQRERFNPANARDLEKLLSALPFVDADDEEQWAETGWILGRAFAQSDAGFARYSAWAGRSRKHNAKKTKAHYYTGSTKPPSSGHFATTDAIYQWAREAGWMWDGEMELRAGELPEIMDQCSALLGAAEVYSRSGRLVDIRHVKEAALAADDIRRDPAQLVIAPVSVEGVRVKLGRLKTFTRHHLDGKSRSVDFPSEHARALVGQGEWKGVAELRGIADAPTMRRDGSVVQAAGYDAASGLYLNLEGTWPTVPDRPSKGQAARALKVLLEPFEEFPFEDEAARAAFVATVLGAVVRPTLSTAPASYFIAPSAGAGKTLLVDAVAMIVGGRVAPKRMLPTNDDSEVRKVITSSVLAGDRSIVFDNIPRGHTVRSPALDAAITATTWSDRRLGSNEQVVLPFALCVFLTGNNISCHTDAVRRGIYIHIDPKCELPEERAFSIPDLLGHLREHRRDLLVAALTVLRGHAVASERVTLPPLGSFEEWSGRVREAVVGLGMEDPVSTQKRMHAEDEDRDELNELLERLVQIAPDGGWFRAAAVMARSEQDLALRHIVDEWGAAPSAKSIGRRLRSFVNQISAGRQLLSQLNSHDKVMEFKVRVHGS